MPYALNALLALLWVVFGVSAWHKLRDGASRRAFAASLAPLGLLPARLLLPVAVAITVAESVIAAGAGWASVASLARWPAGRPVGLVTLVVGTLLLVVLTAGVAIAVRRGTDARCACFGATERPLRGLHVVRNGLLLLATGGGLVVAGGFGGDPANGAGGLLGCTVGAVAGLILVRLDDVVDLFAPVPGATRPAPTSAGS